MTVYCMEKTIIQRPQEARGCLCSDATQFLYLMDVLRRMVRDGKAKVSRAGCKAVYKLVA